MNKLNELVSWFADKNKVIIALSGGVDSAVVAYAAFQALGKFSYCSYSRLQNII